MNMIAFLLTEIIIILVGFLILLGHSGLAGKVLIGVFYLIFFAVIIYLIQLINNAKK